jgi:hypothetical protein
MANNKAARTAALDMRRNSPHLLDFDNNKMKTSVKSIANSQKVGLVHKERV